MNKDLHRTCKTIVVLMIIKLVCYNQQDFEEIKTQKTYFHQ